MEKPAFLRYLPARLKPVANPAVWAPLAVFTLLSVFLWEWHRNPDWFNRQPLTNTTPQTDLTPEEQARLADVDNLDALIEGARITGDVDEVTGQIDLPASQLETSDSSDSSDGESPFAQYEAEYAFPGSANADSQAIAPTNRSSPESLQPSPVRQRASRSSGRFNFGDGLVNPDAPGANSAFSGTLNRQTAIEATEPGASANPQAAPTQTAPTAQPSSTPEVPGVPTPTAQPIRPIGAPSSTAPPVNSPPIGTTGYQTPTTSNLPVFNTQPAQPTPNPLNVRRSSAGQPATAAPGVPQPVQSGPNGALYTAPSSTQPDQGPAINPRR